MSSNARNSKVIVILVLSMSGAAAGLFLFETPTHDWVAGGAELDTNGWSIESVMIEAASGRDVNPQAYDCTIMPDGRCYWQPGSSRLRLAIVGEPGEAMKTPQARTLLRVLEVLKRAHGLDLRNVSLIRQSGFGAPERATALKLDLRDLLVKKGIIQ